MAPVTGSTSKSSSRDTVVKVPPSCSPSSRRDSPSPRGSQGELPVCRVVSSQLQVSLVPRAHTRVMQGEQVLEEQDSPNRAASQGEMLARKALEILGEGR